MPFQHLLTDRVWVSEPTGVDNYGEQSYGPTTEIAVALEEAFNTVLDLSGSETLSGKSFATGEPVSVHARVWFNLADIGDPSLAATPINVSNAPSRIHGTRLYEVFF